VKQSSAAGNSRLTAVLEQFANSLLLLLLLPGPMPLDSDPIYCAEQIVIPPDLGDILKAYAKEVIRNEPEDIFEFSAKYFAQFVTSGGYTVHARVSASVSAAAAIPGRCQAPHLLLPPYLQVPAVRRESHLCSPNVRSQRHEFRRTS
jgi:hypothetical protein